MQKQQRTWLLLGVNAVVGAILVGGVVATRPAGLDQVDREAYDLAMDQQEFIDTLGFPNYRLADYPVAFYGGDTEFVVFNGQTTEREPAYDSAVGTATFVDGRMEVFVMNNQDTTALTAGSGEAIEGSRYTQATVIWHESFHAWQQVYGGFDLMALVEGWTRDPLDDIDASAAYQKWFVEDMGLLIRARDAQDEVTRKAVLEDWVAHQDGLAALGLEDWVLGAADMYEFSEGGAKYIETTVARHMMTDTLFDSMKAQYTVTPEFLKSSNKYYNSGMIKAQLLDLIAPGWQQTYRWDGAGFAAWLAQAVAAL
jgi:hypothetical protein